MDGKYVAISSGLPWWTGQSAQGFRFMHAPAVRLLEFKDYFLFKNSATQVVADGYFDNQWKVTATEIEKLQSSGAVSLKK
jgi:hypothetical protein